VLDLELASHPQTILAYEMNGEALTMPHGAPFRLRAETQLGYKMVKWIRSIEFVADYKNIGMGQGATARTICIIVEERESRYSIILFTIINSQSNSKFSQ
jgi:DMSO/TMAO reductase YedYZ molybdopterin-dependent catalytic subunit